MALEKTKEDKLIEPTSIKKTRRNKRKTECSVNRRNGCGICGSLNIAFQGVRWCEKCGEEIEVFTEHRWGFLNKEEKLSCDCHIIINNRRFRSTKDIIIEKCIDCGAVRSKFCPNDKRHNCWKSWDGKKYCSCGFRQNKSSTFLFKKEV